MICTATCRIATSEQIHAGVGRDHSPAHQQEGNTCSKHATSFHKRNPSHITRPTPKLQMPSREWPRQTPRGPGQMPVKAAEARGPRTCPPANSHRFARRARPRPCHSQKCNGCGPSQFLPHPSFGGGGYKTQERVTKFSKTTNTSKTFPGTLRTLFRRLHGSQTILQLLLVTFQKSTTPDSHDFISVCNV